MKKVFVLLLICTSIAYSQYKSGETPDIFSVPISSPLDFIEQPFDVISYDVELDLTKAPLTDVIGICRIAVQWKGSPIGSPFYFHLRDLKIDSAFYQNIKVQPREVGAQSSATYHYEIDAPEELSTSSATITIYYSGKMTGEPKVKGMSWGGVQSSDGILYAMGVGFYNNYVSSTQHWMPCYDHPSDKALFHAKFMVRNSYSVASNGILNKQITDGINDVYEYTHSYPCATYLYTFAVGPFEKLDFTKDTLPMCVWSETKDTNATRFTFKLLPRAVAAYEMKFGKYPFETVGYVNTPTGSMEHETMVCMDAGYVRSIYSNRDTVNSVAYHELAHQWFGDYITCRDFRSAWLNESFATFCESIWREDLYSWNGYLTKQTNDIAIYFQLSNNEGIIPLHDYPRAQPSSNYPGTIYYKGSVVIGMLRYELGDSLFFGAIRSYLSKYKYGVATTEMLKQELESYSGKDLTYFLNQWVYGKGYPIINAQAVINNNIDGKTKRATITLKQTQDASWGTYINLPIEIGFKQPDKTFKYFIARMSDKENIFVFDSLELYNQGPQNALVNFNNGPSLRTLLKMQTLTVNVSDDNSSDSFIEIYPNPCANYLSINYKCNSQSISYIIYNSTGLEQLKGSLETINTYGNQRIDVSNLASGMYYIVIKDGADQIIKSISIVK